MALLFQNRVSREFADKVIEISNKLGIDPNWLMFVMWIETARTFSPSITNRIGCVGLIQFCSDPETPGRKIIGGKTYNLYDIKNMSATEQLDLVYQYYKPYRRHLVSYEALFLATLTPAYLDEIDNDAFNFPNSIYQQNELYFDRKYGNSMYGFKRTLADLVESEIKEFYESFLKKKNGTLVPRKRNILQIYQREIIITIAVAGLLIALWFVGKKLFIKN